uniref:E2 ubiquitin-conjugating enzyme n=1 Tax=Tetraselmis sp. GSL018 TaxID=582737 RepID=A0A061RJZ0_9CHLO|mmetsp:Transcript_4314/g.10435  ORF Transcript_4314/g.10435 Transcript_4314/m.10435 type:complete len:192 (+) Transcript_4314:90-665(+)|eukprot:CAMPEP_0177589444 /NCGR_PEP_ID=MMETSP0419_2-20121207/6810_1 /TAXON_ID=582737 /ORGANISM="Tetraselmis sp., Strain GSL018" /LENGTH=191 /DNA_ID=CAMNT_0019079805 /DNA_START=236 /DNA_END=811 /DNA_ORIENTATION=-
MLATARIQKELKEIGEDETSGISVELVDGSLCHLKGSLQGPKDTPYEGGVFYVDIKLNDMYPFKPPEMRFITKVWHPNVSSVTGVICLDILKDDWSPAFTLKVAMLSLQALLSSPEPSDPQDAVVAKMYMSARAQFDQTAKQWTDQYAKGAPNDEAANLVEMGFDVNKVMSALAKTDGNQERALEILLQGS